MSTLDLFSPDETPVPPPADVFPNVDMDAIRKLALLYTATDAGNNSGIRFMMSVDDAMRFCESPISRGTLHGTQWAYFWTRVSRFVECYWMGETPCIDLRNAKDDGSWDRRIAELGCKKISLWEFSTWLNPHGVAVKNEPLGPS